jgi:hypothetical protein
MQTKKFASNKHSSLLSQGGTDEEKGLMTLAP